MIKDLDEATFHKFLKLNIDDAEVEHIHLRDVKDLILCLDRFSECVGQGTKRRKYVVVQTVTFRIGETAAP